MKTQATSISETSFDSYASQSQTYLAGSINELSERFSENPWIPQDVPGVSGESHFLWYGRPDEEIIVNIFKGRKLCEPFHRHDFFFFDYAYDGDYRTLSGSPDNLITVHEGELYVSQPFAGYGLQGNPDREITIVSIAIQRGTFFKSFLPIASANDELMRFFIDPESNERSDKFLRLHPDHDFPIRKLLDIMIIEYAHEKPDTQDLLKSYALCLIMHIARQYAREFPPKQPEGPCGEILAYLASNVGQVNLRQLAKRFNYHPNYLSALLHRELGKSFSQIVLEQRMERAVVMLRGTTLPIEKVSQLLGYPDPSNFYKAFREYYGCSPRDYISKHVH